MFHVWGVNAGQMSLMAGNPGYRAALALAIRRRLPALEFLVQRQDPVQQEFCRTALAMHPAEAVAEHRRDGTAFRALSPAAAMAE